MKNPDHKFVSTHANHWLALELRQLPGVYAARAYLTRNRIFTRTMAFDRAGVLLYGLLTLPTPLAEQTVLKREDVKALALWDWDGWLFLQGEGIPERAAARLAGRGAVRATSRWKAPAYLPGLEGDRILTRDGAGREV